MSFADRPMHRVKIRPEVLPRDSELASSGDRHMELAWEKATCREVRTDSDNQKERIVAYKDFLGLGGREPARN